MNKRLRKDAFQNRNPKQMKFVQLERIHVALYQIQSKSYLYSLLVHILYFRVIDD